MGVYRKVHFFTNEIRGIYEKEKFKYGITANRGNADDSCLSHLSPLHPITIDRYKFNSTNGK